MKLYIFRHKLISRDVVRLHESADEDNLLSHWPTTVGYIYRPDGKPISENASRYLFLILIFCNFCLKSQASSKLINM